MALEAADIIDACGFFTSVEPAGRKRLTEMALIRRFEAGQVIFRQDDPCPGVYIVGSGLVRIYKLAPNGKEHVLHLISPPATFAEVAAILNMPCPANAQAIEDTTAVLLPAEKFTRILREDHAFCLQLLASMAFRVRHFVGLLEDIVLRDALSRVAKYLLDHKRDGGNTIHLPSLKKHLASHLNLTSETLSRCLRQLTDSGFIEPGPGQSLRIIQPEALQEVAEGLYPRL